MTTGGGFGSVVLVLDEVAALDDVAEIEAVHAADDGARGTVPVVIAKGWLPAAK